MIQYQPFSGKPAANIENLLEEVQALLSYMAAIETPGALETLAVLAGTLHQEISYAIERRCEHLLHPPAQHTLF